MPHWNAGKVVGGIEGPRFLVLGPELSPNKSFEVDLTGISENGSGVITRLFDSSTPFGDYVLKVEDNTASHEYAEVAIDAGETVAEKRFIAFAHVKSDAGGDQLMYTNWPGLSSSFIIDITADDTWRRKIVNEVVVPSGTAGNALTFSIHPYERALAPASTGAARVDHLHIRKVINDYTLPLPPRGGQTEIFREIKQASHELLSGSKKSYRKGYRYLWEAKYEQLDQYYEALIAKLRYTTNDILFFPHKDAHYCYLVEWADEMERAWAFGVAALGHRASLSLISKELIHEIPEEVFDISTYTYPEDV